MKKLLTLVLLLVCSLTFAGQGMSPGMGQVAYGGGGGGVALVDSGAGYIETNSQTTVTLSATVTAGANLLVVFTTGTVDSANTHPTGVTYNGVAMTNLSAANANADWYGSTYPTSDIWYLLSPATGAAHNIVATWAASKDSHALAWSSFSGANATTPMSGGVGANAPADTDESSTSVTPTGFTSGDIIVGVATARSGSITSLTAGQTSLVAFGNAGVNNMSLSQYRTTTGAITSTIVGDTSSWASSAGVIKQ